LRQPEIAGLQEVEQRAAMLLHARALRGRLLEHFAARYVNPDALLGLVQRDFPGLPDAYAAAVLREATTAQRQRMTEARRVPLALAEKARELLREAKLTRALEGFYLQDSHCDETCALVLSLLSRQAAWPQSINLEIRQGSDSGRRLGLIFPEGQPGLLTTLVRNEGRYRLYNEGRASDVEVDEPRGWEQVLLAMLAPSDRQRLGWAGDDAPAKVRRMLQQSLPSSRRDIALSVGISPGRPWFNPGRRMPMGAWAIRSMGVVTPRRQWKAHSAHGCARCTRASKRPNWKPGWRITGNRIRWRSVVCCATSSSTAICMRACRRG
jgi:hypothetical protein